MAVRSATDPDGFSSDHPPMMADGSISPDVIAERYRQMPAADLLAWFDTSRAALVAAFADIAPGDPPAVVRAADERGSRR